METAGYDGSEMVKLRNVLFDWAVQQRGLRRWNKAARHAPMMSHALLRAERARARKLRYSLNEVISTADNRLALPMIGSNAFPKPHGTDWSWRYLHATEYLPVTL